jgi:hypothetical protein
MAPSLSTMTYRLYVANRSTHEGQIWVCAKELDVHCPRTPIYGSRSRMLRSSYILQ